MVGAWVFGTRTRSVLVPNLSTRAHTTGNISNGTRIRHQTFR